MAQHVDLEPHEYRTEPRPNEPLFGPGWPFALGTIVTIVVVSTLAHNGWAFAGIGAVAGGLLTTVIYQIKS